MPHPVLRCDHLTIRLGGQPVVDDLSFMVAAGECYGLLGPNGAGKTTTISAVCGLRRPDLGTIRVNGHDPSGRAGHHARRHLGLVPQDISLFPELTVAENLEFWARMSGVGRRERRSRSAEVLDLVGLADRARTMVKECSGGMQRRANLAAALMHRPRLLLLDEPTVGIDPHSRNRLLDLVGELTAAGSAVLYTSHYMEEVQRLCHRVGIMDRGVMVAEGTVADLLADSDAADLEARFLELTGTALRD